MTGFVVTEWRLPARAVSGIALVLVGSILIGRFNEHNQLSGQNLEDLKDVAIILDFEPERFHIEAFQDVGRYQGWKGDHAVIRSANPDELRRLARNYWVSSIKPLEAMQ